MLPDDADLAEYLAAKARLNPGERDLAEVAQYARMIRGEPNVFSWVKRSSPTQSRARSTGTWRTFPSGWRNWGSKALPDDRHAEVRRGAGAGVAGREGAVRRRRLYGSGNGIRGQVRSPAVGFVGPAADPDA